MAEPFTITEAGADGVACIYRVSEIDKYIRDDDGGMVRHINTDDDDPAHGVFEIIFDVGNPSSTSRFYCFITAADADTALLIFFKEHSHINYSMIVDIMEV